MHASSHKLNKRLIYYAVRVNKAQLNDQWQSIINPHKNQQQNACPSSNPNAFYLQHRKTYGNYHWLRRKLRTAVIFDIVSCALVFAVVYSLRLMECEKETIHTVLR